LFAHSAGSPSEYTLVKQLREMITISPLRDTDIIEIRGRASTALEAAAVANAMATAYVQTNTADARGEIRDVKGFLEEQLGTARTRLAQSEEELKAYQERGKVASLPEETASLVDKLAYFAGLYNEAQVDLQTSQKRLEASREQLAEQQKGLVDQVAQVSSPVINQLRGDIANLEAIRSKYLAQGYGKEHEKMVEIERRIKETRNKLLETAREVAGKQLASADPLAFSQSLVDRILGLQVEIETLAARVSALKAVADTYETRLEQLPEKSLQLARLERAAKVNENVLTMLMEKYEESRITEAGETGSVRIIDEAREPERPVRPKKKLNVLFGCVLGLLMSAGYTLARDRTDRRVIEVEELEAVPQVPVLGWVPAIRTRNSGKTARHSPKGKGLASDTSAEIERRLLVHLEPYSPESESYRTLRTNIRFLGVDRPVKSIVVSSPGASEGKSTTVANLALTMAQAGARTLLVDSDLRRPTLDSILKVKNGLGLTELLTGTRPFEDCLTQTGVQNLSVIGSGTLPPNPSEMLGSERMRKMVEVFSGSFDYVLFDSPPILAVTDAAVLSSLVDLTVVVVRSGRTSWTHLSRALALLRNVRARQIGTVLNAVETGGLYRHYGYYGYYAQHNPEK
jgi:tyrosine-protein kinase Etk/Wzc